MDPSLDEKDRAILAQLERDGRALIKTISTRTGIPRDSVNYRIKRMRKNGVIKGFAPICDTDKMGRPVYCWVCMQLQHFDEKVDAHFREYLRQEKSVIYIAQVTGAYHYIFTIAARTIKDLDKVLRGIAAAFPESIKTYTTSLMVEETQYDTFHRLIGSG